MKKLATIIILMSLATGCTVGPNYKRPSVDVPGGYRGAPPSSGAAQTDSDQQAATATTQPPQSATQSLGDEKWWEVFQDKQLQELIRTALQNNYDVNIAAARILKAQAQLGITRADQLPTLSAGAAGLSANVPRYKNVPNTETGVIAADVGFNWQLDFWGKYRRQTEAARANLLASQWAREYVISTLVSNVAASYFQLRTLDLQLEISRRTLAARKESLKLTQTLVSGGRTNLLDQRQAEQLVASAGESIPALEKAIAQQENYLSTLLGNNPGPIARGLPLTEQPHAPEVPAGLPSALLERRPDIRQAEELLIAANARIGVAKAAYYPDISLTGTAGYASSALNNLFTGPAGFWLAGATLTQPIFTGGRLKSGVKYSEAEQQELLLVYKQTIQQAFRGVSDSLVAYEKNREFREYQEQLKVAAQDSARLSEVRYSGGRASYLEVLTNETNYFNAELGLAQSQLNELLALVDLYRNLGGGWQS
ncbi:MAG TPA: efflux transporter outer membrane subunit [Terriglobales bacterium]|nr:efflux transporter outer membrane subunit [Terriglobales bacterium]